MFLAFSVFCTSIIAVVHAKTGDYHEFLVNMWVRIAHAISIDQIDSELP